MEEIGLAKTLSAGLVLLSMAAASHATTVTYSTAQSQFDSGILNQGWWSATYANSDDNDNHFTGNLGANDQLASFYSFDLTSLSGTVTAATIRIRRSSQSGTVQLGIWDVSTAAATVNSNGGTSASIFNDLSGGISYGAYSVGSGDFNDTLSFSLNAQALADINASVGFFSVGMSVGSDQFIYSFSGGDITYLDLQIGTVPEPGSLALLGIAGLALLATRRRG